ncbi:MAG: dihydrofolate reductase family protein [Bacteroidota bacterium]|nr:dihydrofolate reductase family protein [Bacteroidota bacterium]
MKKLKFFIIASIDGYIACPWDDDIKWFAEFPNPSKNDYGYRVFFDSTDTIIMDELVYNEILCLSVIWPYKDKVTYVISRFERKSEEDIRFVTDGIAETLARLKQQSGKDIWLIGGEAIAKLFDQSDEMHLVYIPIIHGNDKPLFPEKLSFSQWTLSENNVFDNGTIRLTYQRK